MLDAFKFLVGSCQHVFFFNFPIKFYYCQKRWNFRFFYCKNNLCRQKVLTKLHVTYYYGSCWVMSVWIGIFRLAPRKFAPFWTFFTFWSSNNSETAWKTKVTVNNILYVVSYDLYLMIQNYFSNERTCKCTNVDNIIVL
jgi:hypothetical protein